jgi:hypothetical protein
MRLVRNCNAAASSWRRAAVSASRAFFSLSLMISKIKSSRVARGMPSRSALRSIHSLHSPGARLARRFASAIARLAFSCESDFRLREIEHLLITAHDVDYLLSTERRRARWSLEYRHALLPNQKVAERLARFRQVNMEQAYVHHDALEFPNGKIILLARLSEGQHATVLQLPASPRATNEAEQQKRDSLVS